MKWNIANKLTVSFGLIVLLALLFSIYSMNTQSEYNSDIHGYQKVNNQIIPAGVEANQKQASKLAVRSNGKLVHV